MLQTSGDTLFQYMVYFLVMTYQFFDIFMITYYGNEIMFLSGNLSLCLFKSNWMDQSEKCKRSLIILMEVLKQPQVLVIGKLYPLDLEIFTNVNNFFNELDLC